MIDVANTNLAQQMMALAKDLFPLHRSMTGKGVRETLERLQVEIPLEIDEVPTGTQVFDWVVPKEWTIRDAFIADANGRRLVDYKNSNLHVVNGSIGIDRQMLWQELSAKVHYLPNRPGAIPYRTTFFEEAWGFCVTESNYKELAQQPGSLHVKVDAEYFDGSLSIGECTLEGATSETVLIYCHTCHPSLANDNLSGIALATQLAKRLMHRKHRLTYRFVFAPATIGAIAWLARNEQLVPSISHGLVLSLLGNDAAFTYKKSRRGNSIVDKVASDHVLGCGGSVREFSPFGYDERQFCSPGFDLPIGCLTRAPFGEFNEYHSSDDNLSYISGDNLVASLNLCESILSAIESLSTTGSLNASGSQGCDRQEALMIEEASHQSVYPVRACQKCEPYLRKHNLHRRFGELGGDVQLQQALMWVLNLSDGRNSIQQMSLRSKLSESDIVKAVRILAEVDLLEPVNNLLVK